MSLRQFLAASLRQLWHLDYQTRLLLRLDLRAFSAHHVTSSFDTPSTDRGQTDTTASTNSAIDESPGSAGGGGPSSFDVHDPYTTRQQIGLILGPLVFVSITVSPTPTGLTTAGQIVAGAGAWMAIWWVSEAIPIPVTALLPLFVFPITGAVEPVEASAPYANRLVFLFLGGFLLAVAIERWELHRRIALLIISVVGTSPNQLILGFMLATAFLSMWVSNTATAMMMTPIGLAVVHQTANLVERSEIDIPTEPGEFRFGMTLMLSIAYAASIGGVGTLIGSPPNIIFAGFVESTYGQNISFAQWMLFGVPISITGIGICWLYLTRGVLKDDVLSLPGDTSVIQDRRDALGPMGVPEKLTLVVFGVVAVGWLTRRTLIEPYVPFIDDAAIAILGAVALFVIPVRNTDGELTFLLDWTTGVSIPWGVILLFGGGLSLANAVEISGLAEWIGTQLYVIEGLSLLWIVLIIALLSVFLTEVTSNTAMTAMFMPILGALAIALAIHPFLLMVTATAVASLAFMLPVATPPNAVVFGSGYLRIPQMAKVGFLLNLVGTLIVVVFVLAWLPAAWGIDSGLPEWIE